MAAGGRAVYVFSVIPRLAKLVQDGLPDVKVIEVNYKGGKKVCEEEVAALQDAEILLVDNSLLAEITDRLPSIKWAQGTWAGVDAFLKHLDKPRPTFPISRMVSDSFSQLMVEHTIGWILTHERGWLECRQNQLQSEWVQTDKIGYYRCLKDLTVGVLGMGNIGKEVARSLKAFHSVVHAFTRTVPAAEHKSQDVDQYWHTGELPQFLKECDYVVNIMPSTPDTRGMLGKDILQHAKKDAIFINIGRGDVISEEDLIKALDAGWLSAAILDVFEVEPLPKTNSLWTHPKVRITPHTAGVSRAEDVAEAFLLNYHRFISGQQVRHIIDWKAGY